MPTINAQVWNQNLVNNTINQLTWIDKYYFNHHNKFCMLYKQTKSLMCILYCISIVKPNPHTHTYRTCFPDSVSLNVTNFIHIEYQYRTRSLVYQKSCNTYHDDTSPSRLHTIIICIHYHSRCNTLH